MHPGTTLVIESTGYRRKTVTLSELRMDGKRERVRIGLDRGFTRTLRLQGELDDGEIAGIEGARVLDRGHVLGRTDESGMVSIDVDTWPDAGLTIEADGYRTLVWRPADGFADRGKIDSGSDFPKFLVVANQLHFRDLFDGYQSLKILF